MTEYNFYRDGGNGEVEVSVITPYMPTVMRQIASTLMTEFNPVGEVNAIVQRPAAWIESHPIDAVTASINEEMHVSLEREESRGFMIGTRYDEPQGVFTTTAYQRIQDTLSSDSLIALVYALSARHRARAAFLCSTRTLRDVQRLHDADGRFIYQPPPCKGVPGRLLDFPVFEDDNAPHRQLALGDWREAYQIASSPVTKITRDPFSKKPLVLFHAKRHVGGMPMEHSAAKVFCYEAQ